MRKWMRERMKRRKKPEQTAGTESTKPVPLQPDYYDTQAPASAESGEPDAEPQGPGKSVAEPAEVHAQLGAEDSTEGNATSPDTQRRRRRRSRGGRGRGASRATKGETLRKGDQAAATVDAAAAESGATVDEAIPVVPPTTPARAPKGVVVLAIGLPGSGKSSWFKRHQIHPLSSDLLRALLFDDAQEQRFQDLVFSNLRSMLKARLIARRPMNYLDATNLTPHERGNWIKLAKDYGYEVHAVFFDVPLDVCLERNRKRQRVVDEAAMHRMSAKLRPPTFDEGFSKITVVRVKKKDGEVVASEAS